MVRLGNEAKRLRRFVHFTRVKPTIDAKTEAKGSLASNLPPLDSPCRALHNAQWLWSGKRRSDAAATLHLKRTIWKMRRRAPGGHCTPVSMCLRLTPCCPVCLPTSQF
uniref:Uncharacterized protein n=1 Tax=Cucumis sativus TaxID=3659 RepID=A0A0A0L390_CUCSA